MAAASSSVVPPPEEIEDPYTTKTLQDLAANKLFNEMMDSNQAIEAFTSLDFGEQHVLLQSMLRKARQVRESHENWVASTTNMPLMDITYYISPNYLEFRNPPQQATVFQGLWEEVEGGNDDPFDGEMLRDMRRELGDDRLVWWHDTHLVETTDSDYIVVEDTDPRSGPWMAGEVRSFLRPWGIYGRISPQLFMFRIWKLFGWTHRQGMVHLKHIHDDGALVFDFDSVFHPRFAFYGSRTASNDALEVVNFLLSDWNLHP